MGVEVHTRADHHELEVTGMDRVWGLRLRVTIPFSQLADVRVVPAEDAKRDVWLRTGGLAFPGRSMVGHFRGRKARRQYWRWWGGDRVVAVDLKPGGRFDRIVLEVGDPDSLARQLRLPMPT